MFFDSWSDIVRVAVLGSGAYLALVIALRASGKRTLAKLNAFDLVVTVALGSTLATILLSKDVSFVEGMTAFAVLIGAQFGVAWLAVRIGLLRRAARSEPALLLQDGRLLDEVLRRQRVTAGEVRQAVRGSGHGGLDVAAVVLETDGTLSVIPHSQRGDGRALSDVHPIEANSGRRRASAGD